MLLGGLRGRTVEYTTFGYGEILNFQNLFIAIEIFEARAVPLHSISVNPQKARFGPESASWGVTGSYRSVCYIGMGDY